MATFEITAPDGRVFEIEGDNQEGALAALKEYLGDTAPAPKESVSHTGGLSGHATQGALFGFGDEYLAGLSAVLGVQPDGKGGANWFQYDRPIGERYDTALGQIRSELGEYQAENPGKALTAQITGGVATAIPAASALPVKAAATTAGRVGQVAGGGAVAGAIEGFGSGEGGATSRAISSGIGAGVGAVFAPVVGFGVAKIAQFAQQRGGQALSAVFRNRRMFDRNSGELTKAGRDRLAALGYNADELSKEMQTAFGVTAERATREIDDAALPRVATASRFGVPLTSGQATGDVIQSASEEAYRAGARGAPAAQVMQGFDEVQGRAVEAARQRVADQAGGRAVDKLDAADAVIAGVQREATAARQAGSDAYRALEESGAAISGDSVRNLGNQIATRTKATGYSIGADTPNASAAIGFLRNTFDSIKAGAVPFMDLERARQQFVRLRSAAYRGSNGADQTVMDAVMEAYDGWLDDTVTAALMQGDEAVIGQAQQARQLWGKYRQTFLSKEGADNFIRKIVTDDLAPDQVAGWLYGAATTPGGGQTSLVAKRIKNILGEASEEWQMVRRAAFDHITKAPEGKSFGPQKVVSNLSEFIGGKGKTLARELFSADELRQIGEFRDMLRVLVPPPRSTNPSGTAYELQRGMMQMLGTLVGAGGGPVGAMAGRQAVMSGTDFAGKLAAKAATRGIGVPKSSVPVAIGSGVAAGGFAQDRTIR